MSKDSGGGDSTTTVLPPSFQIPYIQQGLAASNELLQNPPEVYTGPGVAPLSDDTVASFNMARDTAGVLQGFSTDLLGGFRDALNTDFLNNPAYQASADQLRTDVMSTLSQEILPGLDTQAAALGAFGGTDYLRQQNYATSGALEAVSSGTAQLMRDFYSIESQGRNAALGTATGVSSAIASPVELLAQSGSAQDVRAQAELTDSINTFNAVENAPEAALDRFIARVYGDIGSTSVSEMPSTSNRLGSGIGGAIAGGQIGGPWGALIGGIGGLILG